MGERGISAGDGQRGRVRDARRHGSQSAGRGARGDRHDAAVRPGRPSASLRRRRLSYLVRRLEENASSENFLSAAFELETAPDLFEREEQRFAQRPGPCPAREPPCPLIAIRTGRRRPAAASIPLGSPALPAVPGAFRNTPDTDLCTPANQAWAEQVTARIRGSVLGEEEIRAARVDTRRGRATSSSPPPWTRSPAGPGSAWRSGHWCCAGSPARSPRTAPRSSR